MKRRKHPANKERPLIGNFTHPSVDRQRSAGAALPSFVPRRPLFRGEGGGGQGSRPRSRRRMVLEIALGIKDQQGPGL